MAATILIIEDERDIAELVASRLHSEGFITEICGDGLTGVDRCAALRPDLVVLDLMLPGIDGVEACRRIQQHQRTPVVMLTARDDETDVLVGLGIGADDYVTKPFSPRELVARIQAVLRRSGHEPVRRERFRFGPIVVDESTRTVEKHGEPVHLTATEFDLLHALTVADGAVLSREQLLQRVWGYREASGARTVDSHVRAIRRKLGDDLIRTVHAVGYALGVDEPVVGTP